MPVTSRKLQVYQVSGAGKKGPTNLRWDNAKKHLVNILCDCQLPQLPNPITIEYTAPGTYTDVLPPLPSGYNWQINGTLIPGGGGGGGGGGGLLIIGSLIPGGGGFSTFTIFSIPLFLVLPGGASVTSIVGAGGAGGAGGPLNSPGAMGSFGGISSVNAVSSPPSIGGIGGPPNGVPQGQLGGTQPGSCGSGGNGNTVPGGSGQPGGPGRDGRVFFTATPAPV